MRTGCAVVLVGMLLVTAGCGGGKAGRLPVYPARGKVLLDGRPTKGIFVYCWPGDIGKNEAYCPTGQTDEQGNFVLSTYGENDGAPEGEYVVTLEWPERFNVISNRWEGDRFKKAPYNDRNTSPLRVTIRKQPNELEALQLSFRGTI